MPTNGNQSVCGVTRALYVVTCALPARVITRNCIDYRSYCSSHIKRARTKETDLLYGAVVMGIGTRDDKTRPDCFVSQLVGNGIAIRGESLLNPLHYVNAGSLLRCRRKRMLQTMTCNSTWLRCTSASNASCCCVMKRALRAHNCIAHSINYYYYYRRISWKQATHFPRPRPRPTQTRRWCIHGRHDGIS